MLLLPCREGEVIPWELIKRGIEASHPFSVFTVRSMLAVPFFEKAVYELPEEQVIPEAVTALADSIEKDVEGGLAGRYCLCPPASGPPPANIIATASHLPCLAWLCTSDFHCSSSSQTSVGPSSADHSFIAVVTDMQPTLRCPLAPGHAAELDAQSNARKTTHQQHGCFMLTCCQSVLVM